VLVVLLLGNVIVNESLPIFLDSAIGGGVAAIVISTTMIVIFGEIIPQAVSVRYGLSIGARCVPVVLTLMYLFAPIAWPIAKLLDHVLGKSDVHTYKKAELKSFLQFHRTGEEPLRDDEICILNGVLERNTKKVESIMTPMKDVVTLSSDTILDAKTIESLLLSGYSRFPVHEPGNFLAFSGLLLVKKLLTYDPSQCWPVSKFTMSILPEAKPTINCFQALDYFQTGRAHLLLVSNTPGAAGGAIGVITLEDIIEEIIAEEIVDETDRYEDNQSKRRAKRMTTAAVMRGIVERERRLDAASPHIGERTPLLGISPGLLEVGDLGSKSIVYGSVRCDSPRP
jgi:metal transporter CNNM